jgi:electron transfer flavoprotein alpha subunit
MNILIVGEVTNGELRHTCLETLTAARSIAGDSESGIAACVVGAEIDAAAAAMAAHGVDVLQLDDTSYASYSSEGYAAGIVKLAQDRSFDVVLFADTSFGKDLAPAVATQLQAALATDVVQITAPDGAALHVVHPMYSGKVNAEFEMAAARAKVLTIRPHTFAAATPDGTAGKVEKVASRVERPVRAVVKEVVSTSTGMVELTEADIVVSGGRSLKSEENFKIIYELAEVLGGAVGASRAAVDAGYQPHSRQVGQTGKVVNPSLYLACGISGAIQHLVGMRTSKVIVAINKDANAPIFQNADYGIVGDLFEVVPILTEECKSLKQV